VAAGVAGVPAPTASPPATSGVGADLYNTFIGGIDLVSIRLVRATIDAASTPERRQLVPAVPERGARYENHDGFVLVNHDLEFTGTYAEASEPVVSIRAEFEVRYSASERMTDALFAVFRQRNLPLNTWPYFREFIHAALARTGWPVFVLPVYHSRGAPLAPAEE
jgi:hypothetical protein